MEIRDLDFANDASAMLSTMVDQFSQGFISQNDRRYDSLCGEQLVSKILNNNKIPILRHFTAYVTKLSGGRAVACLESVVQSPTVPTVCGEDTEPLVAPCVSGQLCRRCVSVGRN